MILAKEFIPKKNELISYAYLKSNILAKEENIHF